MRLLILFILILCNLCKVFPQDSIKSQQFFNDFDVLKDDTEKANALNKLGWNYRNTNTDSAILYVKAALSIASKSSAKSQIAKARFYLGRLYYNKSNDAEALHNLNAALVIYQSLDSLSALTDVHMYKGYVFFHLNRTADVLNEFLLSLQCAEQSGNKKALSNALYSIGDFYLHSSTADSAQIVKAHEYFLRTLEIDNELNLQSNIATDYQYLGVCDMSVKKYREAENYLKQSLVLFKKLDDNFHIGTVCSYLGDLYATKNLPDLSISNYKKAEVIFEQLEANLEAADIADNLATQFFVKKNFAEAIKVAQHGHQLAQQANAALQMFYLDTSLAKFYAASNDYKQAYNYQLQAMKLKDSITKKEQLDKLDELQTKYETSKKDKKIALLNTQTKLDNEKISRQRLAELFSILGAALVIILFIVIINHNRIKQQLNEVSVRNQLATDLHDEVGSSLSSILLLSKMAASINGVSDNKNGMLEKISGNTKDVIDKMSDIVWMMNPKYDDGEDLREKLEQYVSRLKEIAGFNVVFEIDNIIDAIKLPMELRKTIFLIFKEATNNALKYADASWLYIKLGLTGKDIQLVIKDDGKGFDDETIMRGNGLDSMKLRAVKCRGELKIESAEGIGTTITLTIPVQQSKQKTSLKKIFIS